MSRRASVYTLSLRPIATAADLAACASIYAHYVSGSVCTWAYDGEAPSLQEWEAQWRACTARGLPWFVAEATTSRPPASPVGSTAGAPEVEMGVGVGTVQVPSNVIVGYCTVSPYRSRAGWRWTVEHSLYTAPGWQRRGVGRALLSRTIDACRASRIAALVAVISVHGPTNGGASSLSLHEALGFVRAGYLPAVGVKGGLVLDCAILILNLQPPPTESIAPDAPSVSGGALVQGSGE